jgi:transcriptional regulator with XRE-family HTH domain
MTRLRQRLSQVELFRMSGIWPSRISYFEHGLFEPSAKEKGKLSKALKVKSAWLFPKKSKEIEKLRGQRGNQMKGKK